MYIRSLNEIIETDTFGGKGSQLSFLIRNGFPVPDGFVISTEAFDLYRRTNVFPEDLIEEVKNQLGRMNEDEYIVRSSAIGEDSTDNSFAGQLDSFVSGLNINEIVENIKRCWASYSKENVAVYESHTQKKLGGMGVVVQKLIQPEHAGVIFTRSHLKHDNMLVEYVEGMGDKLVSGEVTPMSFHVNDELESEDNDFLEYLKPGLKLAKRIEKLYGMPMDIEWATHNGHFYFVQARAITTPIKSRSVYWSNTNVNENYPDPISPLLYSVARDSYYHYFKNLSQLFRLPAHEIKRLEADFSNVIGTWGCRMYYNMSSIHAIISASPFSEMLIKAFDNFVGYADGNKAKKQSSGKLEKLLFLKEFLKKNRKLEQSVCDFETAVNSYINHQSTSIVQEDLRRDFNGFIEIRMHSWYNASLADFFAMAYHGALGKFCSKYYEDAEGVQNTLIQAIPNLISSKPVIDMHTIITLIRRDDKVYEAFKTLSPGEFLIWMNTDERAGLIKRNIDNYLDNWGFRCSGELMLTAKNYIEEPEKFIALLMQYEKLPEQDPETIITAKHEEAIKSKKSFYKRILKKNGINLPKTLAHIFLLNYLVRMASKGISSRERVRLKQAHVYFGFKKNIQKIEQEFIRKGILENEGDILFLSYTEIIELLDASLMLQNSVPEIVRTRKAHFKTESALVYPDDFSTPYGAYISPEEIVVPKSASNEEGVLTGLCACGGVFTGTVKVLNSVLEAGKLEKGDILVTRQTDPGWVVVFPLISGLIVERGGMLSHGAIVSREFGIPAVVGVNMVTSILKDGDKITLNATNGEIIIHAE